ncbi:putative RNA-directed DNA polymerase [Helianthus debilis subsp. tardiflorus]
MKRGLNAYRVPFDPPDSCLSQKFAVIRSSVKAWRDEFLTKERESENVALVELESLETELENKDLSEDEEWILAENKRVIKEAENRRNSDLLQRSRVKWAMGGDENSKFFHALVNNRKSLNSIHGLNVNGEWCTKPSIIKKEIFTFFRDRFKGGTSNWLELMDIDFKKNSESDSNMLVEAFFVSEIKEAVAKCGDDRAPGPDGMNFMFIKHFLDLFEDDFIRIYAEFHESGEISIGCGSSFIALIPKVKDSVSLGNFRPINLVGVISNVISKVIANRMRKLLDGVTSDSQSAFLFGRYILDGPLIINELITWIKKVKKRDFFFKMDFEKAYDNVRWTFVVNILRQMGFLISWCKWIMGILKSARSSILVNGAPTFQFRCEKGMRQGDPLSPFLFLVVMEALSRMISRAREAGVIKGIPTPNNGLVMSHLLYADDAIVLGEWSKEEMGNVMRILRCFYLCLGLKINVDKSNLYGIGVSLEETGTLANKFGCNLDVLPFKYLGLKVGANMNRVNNWQLVYETFRSRLAKWKSHILSIGGRVVIIKSVLESLPTYFFSLYKVPKKVVSDLESLIKSFLWGGSVEEKMHWVNWDRVARHKKEGGLGLCKLKEVNISLLTKWGWRYKTENNNLWKKVIDSLHSSRVGWEYINFKRTLSGTWSNIAKVFINSKVGGLLLRNFLKGEIRNDEDISFWLDPWIINEPLKLGFPELFSLEAFKKCKVADRISGQGDEPVFNWAWRSPLKSANHSDSMQQLSLLLSDVRLSAEKDQWSKQVGTNGFFSVKSAKRLLFSDNSAGSWFVMDWCLWVPTKCNIHVWRMEMNKLLTGDALRKRNIAIEDLTCPLCNSEEESVDHVFIACRVAAIIWNGVSSWCKIPQIYAFSIKDLLCFHANLRVSERKKVAVQGIIMLVC